MTSQKWIEKMDEIINTIYPFVCIMENISVNGIKNSVEILRTLLIQPGNWKSLAVTIVETVKL